jgi:hypothetical protein
MELRLDLRVIEFGEEVGLPVLLEAGGSSASNRLLSAGYGIGATYSATTGRWRLSRADVAGLADPRSAAS